MHASHDDAHSAAYDGTDVMPETVYHAVHHLTDVVRKEEWSALCDAALFVTRLLIAGATRERLVAEQLRARRRATRTPGESGAAPSTSALPPCPTLAQWVDTLDVLVHVTLPAALAALRSLQTHAVPDAPATGRRTSLTMLRRCSHALVNLCFCIVVCFERTRLRLMRDAGEQDGLCCPDAARPSQLARQRQHCLLDFAQEMRCCFDAHLALLVWNAEVQLRQLAEGMTAELRGSPALNDLPRTVLYLTPYDDWVWLLLVAVLPHTPTGASHDVTPPPPPPLHGMSSCSTSTRTHDVDRGGGTTHNVTSGAAACAEGVTLALQRLCVQGGDGVLYAYKQLIVVLQASLVFVTRWCDAQRCVARFLRAWHGRRTRFVQDDAGAVSAELNAQAMVDYTAHITTTAALADMARVVQLLRDLVCGNAELFLRPPCRPLLLLFDLLDQLLPLHLLHRMCASLSAPAARSDEDEPRQSKAANTRADIEAGDATARGGEGVYLACFTNALAGLVGAITDKLLLGADTLAAAVLPAECGARVVRLAVLLAACTASRRGGEAGEATRPPSLHAESGGAAAARWWGRGTRAGLWIRFAHDVQRRRVAFDAVSPPQAEQQTRASASDAAAACDAEFSQLLCLGLEALYALFALFARRASLGATHCTTVCTSTLSRRGRTHTADDLAEATASDAARCRTARGAVDAADRGAGHDVWDWCAATMLLVREALSEALCNDPQRSTTGGKREEEKDEEEGGGEMHDGRSSLRSTTMTIECDSADGDVQSDVMFATESLNALRLVLLHYTNAAELQAGNDGSQTAAVRGAVLHRELWLLAVAALRLAKLPTTYTVPTTATPASTHGLYASRAIAAATDDEVGGDGAVVSGFVYALPGESVAFVRDRAYECYEDWSRTRRVSRRRRSILERVDRRRGQGEDAASVCTDDLPCGEHLTRADALLRVSRRFFFAAIAEVGGRAAGLRQAFVYIGAYSDFLRRLHLFSCQEWRGFVHDMRNLLHQAEATAVSGPNGDGTPPRAVVVGDVEAYEAHTFDTALSLFVL